MEKPNEILELQKILKTQFIQIELNEFDIQKDIHNYKANRKEGNFYSLNKKNQIDGLEIAIYNNQPIDSSLFENLIHLKIFISNYFDHAIYDFIKKNKQLEVLHLNHKQIKDISFLSECKKLKILNLAFNDITDISPLKKIKSLEQLDLSKNANLEIIDDFKNLLNLKILILDKTNSLHYPEEMEVQKSNLRGITDISALQNLSKLEFLNLNGNKITDVSALSNLLLLNTLYLGDNYILELKPLKKLNNLINLQMDFAYNLKNIKGIEKLTNLKVISFSNSNIKNISPLKNLTKLEKLNISFNPIKDISPLQNLVNLKELILPIAEITDISALSNMVNLEKLEIEDFRFVVSNFLTLYSGGKKPVFSELENISSLKNLTNLKELDLTGNHILDISALENLINLESLNLGYNFIYDISPLKKLKNLTKLNLHAKTVSLKDYNTDWSYFEFRSAEFREIEIDLSPLNDLTNLNDLNLCGLTIKNCDALTNLKQLNKIDLSNTNISDITFLEGLTNLSNIDLSYTSVSNLKSLMRLSNLSGIEANNALITNISGVENLTKLRTFNLQKNQISDISPILNLNELYSLNLSYNQISNISNISPISNLMKLSDLNLSYNQISDISTISNLKELYTLNFSYNQISDISPISNIKMLNQLNLRNNQISDISPLKELKNLNTIDLRDNQITILPIWICDFPYADIYLKPNEWDMGIYLENNPIQNVPIHIIEQGKIAIKEWFVQQEKYGKEKAYIAKIVVVGEPEAGKTSLVKKLFDENHLIPSSQAEISTLGVEVKTELKFPYSLDNSIQIDCNVWDFGGQDIQYALHQYFISPDALYILVSDYRSEKARFNYWFQTINLLASEESKVIVLLNKFKNATTTNSFDITPYKRDFSKLQISLVEVDLSQTDDKWEHLKSEIAFQLSKLKIVGQEIIKIYTPIKAKITEKIKEGNNYISLEELYKLTEIEGMTDETDIQYMLKYFHESGFLLYFNEDDSLKDYVFLNPNWVTNGIYAALSDEISKNKGRFTKEWIEEFWKTKGYKKYESSKLLNLMKKDKFDICYPLPQNENEFITPMLLPEKEPDINWDYENNVQIRYSYDSFMPEGIISQIIVKLHQLICNENGEYLVWRNGVVLERENAKAFIVKHTNNKEIYIRLKGNQIIELRAIIIESLHSIISRFTKQPEIRIPCNCEKCKSSSEPTFFDYSFLKQEKDNNGEVAGFCTKTKQIIRVDDVLEGIGIPKYQQQKVVFNYLATSNAEQFIKDFFELFKKDLVSRFSKNMNESTYHVVIHSWLKMFAPKDYKIKMEMNLLGGECDLMVESTTNNKINDIFEFKYLPKKATNNRFDNELEEAKKQVKKYLQGDYENYRGIAVVFRALEDYKIDYVTN